MKPKQTDGWGLWSINFTFLKTSCTEIACVPHKAMPKVKSTQNGNFYEMYEYEIYLCESRLHPPFKPGLQGTRSGVVRLQ